MIFFCFLGPGRVPGGSGGAFGFIWTKFQPEWSHFGPVGAHFRFPIFWKPIRGPNSSQESLGSGPIWGPGPMEAEGRHYGGRRPTFWRGVGGRSPPTATQGVWGGGSPPTEKGPLELFAIAKSETLPRVEMCRSGEPRCDIEASQVNLRPLRASFATYYRAQVGSRQGPNEIACNHHRLGIG